MAVCYETKKDYARALDFLDKVVRLNPKFLEAYLRSGLIHFRQKDYDEAEKAFRAALKVDENYLPARYQLALLFIEVGNVPGGLKTLRRVSREDPAGAIGDMARAKLKEVKGKKLKKIAPKKEPTNPKTEATKEKTKKAKKKKHKNIAQETKKK